MCGICVIQEVKRRMLSRRDVFKAGAALAGAAAVTASASPAFSSVPATVFDMTHELHEAFPTFDGFAGFQAEKLFDFTQSGYNLYTLTMNEHTGTHLDAPLHFSADGQSVADIPVGQLIAPLCVVDIKAKAAENADAQLTPDDMKAWIAANGHVPDGACVAMNSGWNAHVATSVFRNADAEGKMHFPGFHPETIAMLLEEANVVGIAVDTLSLDYGLSADFAVHYAWLPRNRWGIECIANLDSVPASGATLIVGAPKHRGGTGGPSRIFAFA